MVVTRVGKTLQIRLDHPKISDSAYVAALRVACYHLGKNAKQLGEITILNKFDRQGFVYERPAQCDAVASGKANDAAVLGATHAF